MRDRLANPLGIWPAVFFWNAAMATPIRAVWELLKKKGPSDEVRILAEAILELDRHDANLLQNDYDLQEMIAQRSRSRNRN